MQTLAGSTRDFVPFAGRAHCLTCLLGKGKPLCFLLLPLHCGFPSRERQVCPLLASQTPVARGPLTKTGSRFFARHTCSFVLAMTHLSRHSVVAPIPSAPLLIDIRRSTVGLGTREDYGRLISAVEVRGESRQGYADGAHGAVLVVR